MLKIILNPHSNPNVMTFDQKVILIGSGKGQTDVHLPDPDLEPVHIKLINENQRFYAINEANDPFASLNGLPFGKKSLKSNDLLQIGESLIRIELEESDKKTKIEKSLTEKFITPPTYPTIPAQPFPQLNEEKYEITNEPISEEKTLDEPQLLLSGEAPYLPENKASSFNELQEENKETVLLPQNAITSRIHPEYLGDFDDESENWTVEKDEKIEIENKTEELPWSINWKIVGFVLFSTVFTFCLAAGALYYHVSAKNADEEIFAAESLADIAMALKYAQIHHIKPAKKNWSDPEFINKTLAQVIPHDYPSLVKIDPQGHLNETSYSLRIYTSTDFSQFLVIAQPAPQFFQWLIPKTAIVIDSKLMQLRKVVDMKTLNRLLVNSNNLDNSNAIEVTNLVKRGELIELHTLAKKRKSQDFSPPKALALLRPGAQDYIYNAPRYYQLGATIMRRAIDLMEMPGSVYEMSRLKQDMSLLSKMQDMVLYSPDGIQLTLDAQKAIAAFVSNSRFLTAYLKFDSSGMIIHSHLIIDDESSRRIPEEKNEIKPVPVEDKRIAEVSDSALDKTEPVLKHPLLMQLITICKTREEALNPLKNQIFTLLNTDISSPIEGFELQLASLIDDYFELDLTQRQEMARKIQALSDEYRLISVEEFMSYLNQAGLEDNCRAILKYADAQDDQLTQLKHSVEEIKLTGNFTDLEKILIDLNRRLVIKNFTDLNQLRMAQKLIKVEAISRLNKLLFSFSATPLTLEFNEEQRRALKHTLQLLLEQEEAQNYYLEEFERLVPKD